MFGTQNGTLLSVLPGFDPFDNFFDNDSSSPENDPSSMKSEGNYRPQTKFAKVMFLHVSVCPQGGCLGPDPGEILRGLAGEGVSRPRPRRGGWGSDPEDGYCCGRYASYWNEFLSFTFLNIELGLNLQIGFVFPCQSILQPEQISRKRKLLYRENDDHSKLLKYLFSGTALNLTSQWETSMHLRRHIDQFENMYTRLRWSQCALLLDHNVCKLLAPVHRKVCSHKPFLIIKFQDWNKKGLNYSRSRNCCENCSQHEGSSHENIAQLS